MQKLYSNLISAKGLAVFSGLLFLLNFLSKFLKEICSVRIPVYPSTVLKFLAVALLLIYFVMYLKTKKFARYIYILILLFGIDLIIKSFQEISFDILYSRSYYFFKGIFLFLFFIAIKDLDKKDLEKPIKILFFIGKLNLLLILIGAAFDINLFQSYPHTDRFGYNGIMAEPGISSYFYILLTSIAYVRYRYQNDTYWITIFMLIATAFLGTKSGYLFIGILIFIHLLYILKKTAYQISFVAVLLTTAILLKDKLIQIAINSFNFGTYLYEKHGLITFITSKRDLLLEDTIGYISENWTVVQYMIGGMDFRKHRVEFEFIDVFLFFGLIGFFVYIIALKKMFLSTKQKVLYVLFLLTVLLISSLSGNLFFSITNSFCFVLVFIYLNKSLTVTKSA